MTSSCAARSAGDEQLIETDRLKLVRIHSDVELPLERL